MLPGWQGQQGFPPGPDADTRNASMIFEGGSAKYLSRSRFQAVASPSGPPNSPSAA